MSDKERIKKLAARLRGREDASALVSRAKKPLFSPEKVAERVPGDGWYAGGTDGVVGAVRHYLGNSDNYVRERLKAAAEELPPEELSSVLMHEDAKRIYLGLPQLYGSLEPSPYRPTIGSSEAPYQVNALLTDTEFDNTILPMYSTWKTGEDWPLYDTKRRVSDLGRTAQLSDIPYLSNAGLSSGFDDRGQYVSLYDVWDYNTGVMGKSGDNIGKYVGGKPFDIYQRYYLDDWLDVPQEAKGNPYIAPSYIEADYTGPDVREYTSGGSIHIKPENRGKFTSLNSRHWGNRKDSGGKNIVAEYPEGYNGEIRQGKKWNSVDRYLSDHPMLGHRLRKAGTLLLDAARIYPLTSFATDIYDSYVGPQDESDKITTPLGVFGRGADIILNTISQVGEVEPDMKKVLGRTFLGKVISAPDVVDDSIKFVRDFSEPVTHFSDGGFIRSFDDGGYKDRIISWAVSNPGGLWQDTQEAAAARKWLRENAPEDFRSLYYNESDDVRKGIDRRFLPDGVEAEEFAGGVTGAIDKAGKNIYDTVDTVASFTPGPVGAATWLGHLAADAVSGNYGSLLGQAAMAGVMGGAGRAAGKYLPRLAAKSPVASTFLKKVGNLADDLSWDRARQDAARSAWSDNLDVRQRFGIVDDTPVPSDASSVVLSIGSNADAHRALEKDTISSQLFDDWMKKAYPDRYENMIRERRKAWGKEIMDNIVFDSEVSPDVMKSINEGTFDWTDDLELSRLPFYRSKTGDKAGELKLNALFNKSSMPYKGHAYIPTTINTVPFASKFAEAAKARDVAYSLLQNAAAAGKLSPEKRRFYGPGVDGKPVFLREEAVPIRPAHLEKPYLHFTSHNLLSSYNTQGHHMGIGMGDMLWSEHPFATQNPYGLGDEFYTPAFTVGHEAGHSHPGYNTYVGDRTKSPHYGFDYSAVSPERMSHLTPKPALSPGVTLHPHDVEAAEGISDALGIRTLMHMSGVNDGTRAYTADDISALGKKLEKRYGFVPEFRFQQHHPSVEDQVWLLNNGWALGGQMNKYDGKTKATGYLQNPYSDKYAAGLSYNVPEYESGQYVLSVDEEGVAPARSVTKPSAAPVSAKSSSDAVSFVPLEEVAVPWDSYADSYTKPFGAALPDDLVSFPVQYGQRLTTGSDKQASTPSPRGFIRDAASLDPEKLSALPSQRDATDTVVGPINPENDLVANPMSLDVSLLTRSDLSGDSFEKVAGDYLSSLTDEERRGLQKELLEQGWLDTKQEVSLSGIRQKSEEAYAIQRKLKSLGYDLGTYGPNHDGIDGKIGRKTRAAFARYKEEHPNSAEESLLDLGKIKTSDTEKALAKRLSFFSEHGPSSEKTGPGVADSSYGEENIGTHYDKKFDDYKIGGFDVSNIYNVPISKNNSGTSPLSFAEFPKTAPSKECASAVTMFFVKNFGGNFVNKYNLRGDAWTMGSNIEQAGGKRIFNLFDDEGAPRVNNKDVTISYVRNRAKNKEYKDFLTENLSVGDVVELLYPNSNKFSKAYEESNGHNQNTHIGMIVEKGGELYVLDNSGGNYHATPLSTVISGKERRGVLITGAVSVNDGTDPRFNTDSEVFVADMKDLGVTPNEKYNNQLKEEGSAGIKYYNYNNEAAYREMAALKRNAKKLMSDYDLSTDEFNKIAALTHAASMAETRNGSLAPGRKFKAESGNITAREGVGPLLQLLGRYTLPNLSEAVSSRIRAFEQSGQLLRGEEPTTDSVLDVWPLRTIFKPVSRGLANVKPGYHFTIYEQQHLPIEGNRAEQPESSAVMGFLTIAKNYKHIKERLSGTEFGKDEGLIMALTALSHNQGLKNIDINIDKYLETGDKEELLQYTYREKEYKEALERQDKEAAKYYKGPSYSRMLLDFIKYNNYKIVG